MSTFTLSTFVTGNDNLYNEFETNNYISSVEIRPEKTLEIIQT